MGKNALYQVIQLEGHKQLIKQLHGLRAATQNAIVRPALSKALTPIVRATRKNLTATGAVESGLLRRSIDRKVKTYRASGVVWGAVGILKTTETVTLPSGRTVKRVPTHYAHLVEKGAAPHVQPNWMGQGIAMMHPGARPKPFLMPALAAERGRSFAILAQGIRDGIDKRLRRKT